MDHRPFRVALAILAFALIGPIGGPPAAAQDATCQDDTPPSPTGGPAGCSAIPACPTSAGLSHSKPQWAGGEIVHYYKDDVGACNANDTCDDPYASCRSGRCKVDLIGLLYRPPDHGHPNVPNRHPAPAVVVVPGSTACSTAYTQCVYVPEYFCAVKADLLDRGYVVLEPLPPGYGVNPTNNSTGFYVSDWATRQVNQGAPCAANHPFEPNAACTAYDLRDEGVLAISHAIPYLKGRSFVKKDADGEPRVAVLGHSFGAIRALGLNTVDFGQRAVVDIAAGSESWCVAGTYPNYPLQDDLQNDVTIGKAPIYFLQPRNDVNIDPTVELSHVAGQLKYAYEAAIFPRVLDASGNPFTYVDFAHICFANDSQDVDRWIPSVVDFIQRYGVK